MSLLMMTSIAAILRNVMVLVPATTDMTGNGTGAQHEPNKTTRQPLGKHDYSSIARRSVEQSWQQ